MSERLSAKEEAERALRDKCFALHFSSQRTELCVDWFINNLSHKEVVAKHNLDIEIQSSRNLKAWLKKKLVGGQ